MSLSSAEASRATGYALAYREARRGLDYQERAVIELRARAGALIAAAAITTSFFGGQILTKHHVDIAGWVAIGCFVLLGFAVLLMLWPQRDWAFSLAPDKFIATYLEPSTGEPFDPYSIERDLALHMGHSAEFNRRQLGTLTRIFRLGTLLLVAEILSWVVALIVQG